MRQCVRYNHYFFLVSILLIILFVQLQCPLTEWRSLPYNTKNLLIVIICVVLNNCGPSVVDGPRIPLWIHLWRVYPLYIVELAKSRPLKYIAGGVSLTVGHVVEGRKLVVLVALLPLKAQGLCFVRVLQKRSTFPAHGTVFTGDLIKEILL